MHLNRKTNPPAIVLCVTGTGMATVRSLAACGVAVHAFLFRQGEPIHFSRYGRKVRLYGLENDEDALLEFLIAYARNLGSRSVVIPTCDKHALMLARHRERLDEHCHVWTTAYDDLNDIVDKASLYRTAADANVPTVAAISCPSIDKLEQWTRENPAPYLLKPSYQGVHACQLNAKNMVVGTRDQLLEYATANGTRSLIVQRLLRGGDGNIFDCYGLCDRDGRAVTMVSHRRLRQHQPDFGSTSFGEIPSGLSQEDDSLLFEHTERLLRQVRYHGIFGIEWLRETDTGRFYLIDFNARPFSSIGHLTSCGVNLPLLAYRELIGLPPQDVEARPHPKHKYWVDMDRDVQTFRERFRKGEIKLWDWLRSIAWCRSFAYADWRDPGPGMRSLFWIGARGFKFLLVVLFGQDLDD